MTCEVVGPDSGDLPPLVDVVNAVGAKTDVAGVALWSGGLPLFQEPLQAFADNDIPIAIPHFYVDEGFYPGDVAVVSGDIEAGAADVAVAMCGDLEGQSGSVAVTQNGLNTTENTYSETFTETMNTECPDIDVLPVELEGIDPAEAVAVAVGIMQANPDLIGAVSTTGGGGTTWALAQEQTNKQIVAYATDYTRENLALIESGEITGVLAQPVFEESRAAAGLLLQLSQGETVEHWSKMPTVVVTEANLDEYLTLLDEVEAYADGL
ncbi:MAG: sugar ABC transporter substrate-binding protein [Gemmatimonadaceae bacterium]|nr:sugar ABC transporter substrate-binding protein [Gemmatimonadaceae bacterium]